MQIDLSNIVKYDSATNALTNGATTVLDIDNITDNLLTYDTATGQIEYDSVAITGIASMTFAQMEALTADQLLALAGLPVHINDVHCNAAGIGGVYMVRDSSPAGWAQISKPWYYAAVSNFPTGSAYTDFEFFATGVGVNGAEYKYDGSVHRLKNEITLGASSAISKACICPAAAWISGINSGVTSVDNGGGSITIKSNAAHGLTTAEAVTATAYLSITGGTGWTPGLCLITDVATNANWITVTATSGGTSSVNTPTVTGIDTFIELVRVTVPPLNIYSRVETEAMWSGKGAGAFAPYMAVLYDNSSSYGNSAEGNDCLNVYGTALGAVYGTTLTHYQSSVPHRFYNAGATNSQRSCFPRLKYEQGDNIATQAFLTSTIDSTSAKTLKIMGGASVVNCRVWIDNYRVTMKE